MKAHVKISNGHIVEAEYLNFNEWFGEAWVMEVGVGYFSVFYVIEGESESDVIDALVDLDKGHHILIEERDIEDDVEYHYAGNAGEPVNLENVSIRRCDIVHIELEVQSAT